jgi:hypothetical protein
MVAVLMVMRCTFYYRCMLWLWHIGDINSIEWWY